MPFISPESVMAAAAVKAARFAPQQHPDDAAVDALAVAMKAKLARQRAKGYGGWDTHECTHQRLSDMLRDHIEKGDPVDVANFCAFLIARGESIAKAAPAPAGKEAGAIAMEKAAEYDHLLPYLCKTCGGYGIVDRRCQDDPLGAEDCPDCANAVPGLERDVAEVVRLLKNREWADHCTTTELGQRLECAITALYNAQAAPAAQAVDVQDAARLAWCMNQYGFCDFIVHDTGRYCDSPQEIRDAIDAAIAASPKGGE